MNQYQGLPVHVSLSPRMTLLARIALAVLVVLVVVGLPYLVRPYVLTQITGALALVIAVAGLNLLSGYGGQISLGHAAYFGLGAYATGVLVVHHDIQPVLAIMVGIILPFIVGVAVSLPALRVRGMYLALVTLAVGVLFPSLVRRFDGLTGGSIGMYGVNFDPPNLAYFAGSAGHTVWIYYVAAVGVVITFAVVGAILHSRLGRAIVALRDNEAAAVVNGVNRVYLRGMVAGFSAALAGLGGGVYAVLNGALVPDSFSLLLTINLLVGMVLGGQATFWGPLFGGFIIYFVPVWTSSAVKGPVAGVIFGALVILFVFVMPGGMATLIRKVAQRILTLHPSERDGPLRVLVRRGPDVAMASTEVATAGTRTTDTAKRLVE